MKTEHKAPEMSGIFKELAENLKTTTVELINKLSNVIFSSLNILKISSKIFIIIS